jgi:cytochrome b6-f complex iron-sulfur subunit
VAGCAPREEAAEFLLVDVSGVAPGGRLVVTAGDIPLELIRTEAGFSARSLLCTHQGCVVTWIELDRQYLCPCHEARFDEQGEPIYGPAKGPLHVFPVEVTGDEARVDLRLAEG